MIERLVELCARRRGATLALAALLGLGGALAVRDSPLDAIPDLTDPQVIVFTEWMGRGPQLVEDQVTYPLVASFLGAPKVTTVRGFSMFGMSFVYVIFEDGTDPYWARSRVLEGLSQAAGELPPGVTPTLGPDATGAGWVFNYVLTDRTGRHDLQQLRALQDFNLRYALAQVPGVAEVASVGGFEKQYQVVVDPVRLLSFDVTLAEVVDAVRASNRDVGGRVIEWGGREYVFRGLGYIQSTADLEQAAVKVTAGGIPVRVADVARVELGPQIRRGLLEWNGEGEAVGAIVVMRGGENALRVIDRVKARLAEVSASLPEGVQIEVSYDRSELIRGSVTTLGTAVVAEMVIVLLVIGLFLFHFRSALVAVVTLPLSVLVSFIALRLSGVTINIMSLAGIIIAIGDMVDASIVLVENAHRKLEADGGRRPRTEVVVEAAKELARPVFGALLVIAVSFLPVFALEAQEGRLFRPLAYTKTFAMLSAAVLSVTVGPALMVLFIRGKIRPERQNPLARVTGALYAPLLATLLQWRRVVLAAALLVVATTAWPLWKLGSEFMPPLDEGALLFMPVTLPNISVEEARRVLQLQDRIIKAFPEVATVMGKAGRAETATDPAPLSMFETVIVLRPRSQWRPGMTREGLEAELDRALELPGMQNALTMPIRARVDMLTTGIRTPVGVKVFGDDLGRIEQVTAQIEERLRGVQGTRSVYAERESLGVYLDFEPDRAALARHGLRITDVTDVLETAAGGMVVDQTVEGRQRFTVNVRYPRDLRSSREGLERILVPVRGDLGGGGAAPMGMAQPMAPAAPGGGAAGGQMGGGMSGMAASPPAAMGGAGAAARGQVQSGVGERQGRAQVPLAQLGRLVVRPGPPMIKNEGGALVSYVYIDTDDRDLGGYVQRGRRALEGLELPAGYRLSWTGQYEFLERVRARLSLLIPLTLLLVAGILYFQFGQVAQVALVMGTVPFSLVGSFWLLYLLGFNTSVAVWVGMIALVGIGAETSTIMVAYLDQAYRRWEAEGRLRSYADLLACAQEAAVLRLRPVLMTVTTNLVGLVPIMLFTGPGADVAKRIASPMFGGVVTLSILTLVVVPAAWVTWRGWGRT